MKIKHTKEKKCNENKKCKILTTKANYDELREPYIGSSGALQVWIMKSNISPD